MKMKMIEIWNPTSLKLCEKSTLVKRLVSLMCIAFFKNSLRKPCKIFCSALYEHNLNLSLTQHFSGGIDHL